LSAITPEPEHKDFQFCKKQIDYLLLLQIFTFFLLLKKFVVLVSKIETIPRKSITTHGGKTMPSLLEMAAEIVAAHASTTPMTKEELIAELNEVSRALSALEKGEMAGAEVGAEEAPAPTISRKKAFGKDKVICMLCGKEMKTLARHLKTAHGIKPGEYRKQFDIPRTQPLAARSYSESRRQMAVDRGLGENLAKARAARGKGRKKK
jgi:predicted transcriptional regulator